MALREVRTLLSYHGQLSEEFAQHDRYNVYEKALRDLQAVGFDGLDGKRVLDLGCGQRFPFALQCAAAGASATALDVNYVRPDSLPVAFYNMLRHNGLKRAIKSTTRRLFYDGSYYGALESAAGMPLRSFGEAIEFVVADPEAANYPLPAGSYDLVASNAVLEHVSDVARFVKEVNRLLVPGGYFYGMIHNYYSLSGGHNLEWAYPDDRQPEGVPPWDHLRDNLYPTWVYLNQLRPEEYRALFDGVLDVLHFEGRDIHHDPGGLEGEGLLTPEIAEQLSEYPRELLLTRSYCIICRKA